MNSEVVEFTKIVYISHCGKCGHPIRNDEIKYQNIYVRNKEKYTLRKIGAEMYPNKCPHCGVLFNSIEITPLKKCEDIYVEE